MVDSLGRSKKMSWFALLRQHLKFRPKISHLDRNLTLECRNESMTERSVEGVTDEVIRTFVRKSFEILYKINFN